MHSTWYTVDNMGQRAALRRGGSFTVNCLHLPRLSGQANFMAVARVLLGLLLPAAHARVGVMLSN